MLGSMGRDGQDTLIVLSNPKLILYSSWGYMPKEFADARKLIPVPPALNRPELAPARNL